MRNNKKLNLAFKNKNDEFYTRFEDVEKELEKFKYHLMGKKIICPCDDENSNFVKFLLTKKDEWKIKSIDFSHIKNGVDFLDIDYSEYDFLITNPPFSKLREFFVKLDKFNINFILIVSLNFFGFAPFIEKVAEEEIFGFRRVQWFFNEKNEKKFIASFFINNFEKNKKRRLNLTKSFYKNKDEYNFCDYDFVDILNVNKVKDIPYDYFGLIAVPITILEYDLSDFEIYGRTNKLCENDCAVDGKMKFTRIIIRRKILPKCFSIFKNNMV